MDLLEVAVAGTSSSQVNSETATDTIANKQNQASEVTGEPPVKVRRVSDDDKDGETYAERSVALDTSQIVTLQNQIDKLQAEKNRVELDLQKFRIEQRACMQQLEVLRNTRKKSRPPEEQIARQPWSFALEKNLEVNKYGGCRVLTYNCSTFDLYVSQKNAITYGSFPGYGIKKVSCVDCILGDYVWLHREIIMDMSYSQAKEMLLSVGHSSAKVTDIESGSGSCVSIKSVTPLCSCSWHYLRSNEFYVGGVGGVIKQYDVRKHRPYLQTLQAPSDLSPVVSLCSTEYGLLSCQRNSCWLWVANENQWEPLSIPVMGPFMSLCYDYESNRALVYCRPTSSGERTKLALCKLQASAASVPQGDSVPDTDINTNHQNWPLNVVVNAEQTFYGSTQCTVMTRVALVKAPGATWAATHSESDSTLFLHGLDEARTMSLPAAEPTLDVCSVQINGNTLLAALSDTRLTMYKAVPTHS